MPGGGFADAIRNGERFDLAHQIVPVAMRYPSPRSALSSRSSSARSAAASRPRRDSARTTTRHRGTSAFARSTTCAFGTIHCSAARTTSAACVLGIAPYVRDLLGRIPVRRFEVMSETGIESVPPRWIAPRTGTRPPAVRRPDRANEGAARRHPSALATARHRHAGHPRRRRRRLRPDGLRGPGQRARSHGSCPVPRLPAARRDRRVLPRRRHLRLPELPRARRQRRLRGDGVRTPAHRERPRRPRQRRGRLVRRSVSIPTIPNSSPAISPVRSTRLVDDPTTRAALGAGARARVSRIALWDAKIDALDQVYAELRG